MSHTKQRRKAKHAADMAALQRRCIELAGQLASAYTRAHRDVHKAGDCLTGSGVLLTLHALGGTPIIEPVVILDGLSEATIADLRRDFARSFSLATQHAIQPPTNAEPA